MIPFHTKLGWQNENKLIESIELKDSKETSLVEMVNPLKFFEKLNRLNKIHINK